MTSLPGPAQPAPSARADVLGAPYTAVTLPMRPDDRGEVVATLVHRPPDGAAPAGGSRAVLHVHGFADYFFQVAAADFWCARGYDFYALDLRRYGRSLLPHQLPGFTTDLREYDEELDAAYARISAQHERIVLSAHSTGGLTVPLWLHERGHRVAGVFLNAPWIDMQGDGFTRLMAMSAVHRVGARQPTQVVPRLTSGVYARSLHRDYDGEWDFDLDWKPLKSFPVFAGWIRAVRIGQARVAQGLDVQAPILLVSSTRSGRARATTDPDATSTDTVLDVERMRRRAPQLGRHVTIAQVEGAMHDVTLSPRPARDRVFAELARFLRAYVEP